MTILSACVDWQADHRTLVTTPIELSPTTTVIRPSRPLRAIGPFNAVYLQIPDDYGLDAAASGKVRTPTGFVAASVVLVDSVGQRTAFPAAGLIEGGTKRELYFEVRPTRDLRRRYERLELRAEAPLRVLQVRWEAGNRYASL